VLRALTLYTRQRFHPGVSLPLAGLLGAASVENPWAWSTLSLWLSIWLILFAARAADDIADLPVDRLRCPARVLPAGILSSRELGTVAAAAALAAMLLTAWRSPLAGGLLLAGLIGLSVFYRLRPRLPQWLHAPLLNSIFPIVMLLGPLEQGGSLGPALLLAGFVWVAVVAHDHAHGIEDRPLAAHRTMGSAIAQAGWGAGGFALASVLGGLHALITGDTWFAVTLVTTSAWMAVLLAGLLRDPSEANAMRIYVPGFLYFLLPLAARVLGSL